jgi:endonuclease G
MKKVLSALLFVAAFVAPVFAQELEGDKDNESEHVLFGRPRGGYPISHNAYYSGYSSTLRTPVCVAYHLTPMYCTGGQLVKQHKYFVDPIIVEKGLRSATDGDIEASGYETLQLLSPLDSLGRGEGTEKMSYSLANVVAIEPGEGFLKVWHDIEERVRDWAKEYGEVWVMTGPVLGESPKRTDRGRIAVPEGLFKIVLRKEADIMLPVAFLLPMNASGSIERYVCSIDKVEGATGLDFLRELPDGAENELESTQGTIWQKKQAETTSSKGGGGGGGGGGGRTGTAVSPHAGDPGDVWVNQRSGIYFRKDSEFYGKGHGTYMEEDVARQLGFQPWAGSN